MREVLGEILPGDIIHQRTLGLTEGTSNKVYAVAIWLDQASNTYGVTGVYGPRYGGRTQKTKERNLTEYQARQVADVLFNDKYRKGYRLEDEQRYLPNEQPTAATQTAVSEPVITDDGAVVWRPTMFAENPPRRQKVEETFSVAKYSMFIVGGQRILISVSRAGQEFYDGHGGHIEAPSQLATDALDLEGDFILDGFWNGESYLVVDAPSDEVFSKRYAIAGELLDGTVGDSIQLAPIAKSTDLAEMGKLARDSGAECVVGYLSTHTSRPGQNDRGAIIYTLNPRAVLSVTGKNHDGDTVLGFNDGLGMYDVCYVTIDEPVKIGDTVEVEYTAWNGHGHKFENPKFLRKVDEPVTSDIQKLLTV